MTQDLTAITTPFGLLDEETREALKAHGGPYELYEGYDRWLSFLSFENPSWLDSITYRVKPAPPTPREWHAGFTESGMHVGMWDSRAEAEEAMRHYVNPRIVHVREVTK